ncbi:glycosyltransferase family 4 protein [Williamsia sp. M5A3_1d]
MSDADATIATAAWTAEFVSALPRTAGGKFYLIQHYEDWWKYVDDTWRLPLTRLVISRWLQRKGSELGVDSVRLPNAIDLDEFPPGPPIAERPPMVCALVSDVGWKRTDLVIEVLIGLRETRPDVSAHVFGTCVRPDGLPDWVQFSRSPEPAVLRGEIYQRARVHICASDAEGWHLPPAEALASGCAVASTDIDGVREYADGTARFSSVGDAAALLQNAVDLLDDAIGCQAAVDTFREKALEYTPRDATLRLLSILTGGVGPGDPESQPAER